MRFVGRGHGAIRATHAKTLELSIDADVTGRATCVLAVDVHAEPAVPLAGPVRLVIRAGGESYTVHALANSSWEPGGPMVVRRSPFRLPGTFATHADAAAADLPRPLVTLLQSDEAEVEVVVEPVPAAGPCVVLFAADPARTHDERLDAEGAAADRTLADDATARTLIRDASAYEPAGPSIRTLVVATTNLPGRTVLDLLADPAVTIETVGLAPPLAAAAAAPSRGPLVVVEPGTDAAELIATAAANHRVVFLERPDRLPGLLARAREVRGDADAVLVQAGAPPVRVTGGEVPDLPSRDPVSCCLFPGVASTALDPAVRSAIAHLLADGVSTRTAARALADLTGVSRRAAYDAVLGLVADAPDAAQAPARPPRDR